MKQNKRDFLEAIGFEGNERDMVKQMLFGIGVGMAFIFMLGIGRVVFRLGNAIAYGCDCYSIIEHSIPASHRLADRLANRMDRKEMRHV